MSKKISREDYIKANGKSRGASLALTILFGPLGLMYSSPILGAVLTVAALLLLSTVVGPVIIWIASIIIGDHCTHKVNNKVKTDFEILMR